MSKRICWLGCLFFLRCVLGWSMTLAVRVKLPVVVSGNVISTYQNASNCIMVLHKILIDSGKICAALPESRIRAFGTFERRLIDSFDGRLWLVTKQIDILGKTQELKDSRTQDDDRLNNLRERMVAIFKSYVPEPEAGLVAGIVLGYKKDMGQKFYQSMVNSGSIHIAVASGYNILLVGGVVLGLCFWLVRRPTAIWIALATMIFYAVLAGGDPPVVRAVWMAGLMYFGQAIGRGSVSAWILLLTAWIMLMIQPSLIASASFQLSIAASFGLMVVEPWLVQRLEHLWGSGLVAGAGKFGILTSVATMVVTLPIIWWHFARMTLIGIVSNVLILPLVPPLMILGVGTLIFPWFFAWPTYALAHWMVLIILFFGK